MSSGVLTGFIDIFSRECEIINMSMCLFYLLLTLTKSVYNGFKATIHKYVIQINININISIQFVCTAGCFIGSTTFKNKHPMLK